MADIKKFEIDGDIIKVAGIAGNGKAFDIEADNYASAFMQILDTVAPFDSEVGTLKHIRMVQENLGVIARQLIMRGEAHDDSKLGPIEKPHFDRESQLLKELKFNSPEYKESLRRLSGALDHHYKANRHHPEFHVHGVADMTLTDIVEMACDWQAAAKRGRDGVCDLESCFERFKFDPQLANIFRQTFKSLGWTTKRDLEEQAAKE